MKLEEVDDCLNQIGLQAAEGYESCTCEYEYEYEYEDKCNDPSSASACLLAREKCGVKKQVSCRPKNCIERMERDDFKFCGTVGGGRFSDVQRVRHNHKGELLALKALRASRIADSEQLLDAAMDLGMEAKILSELNHENIVQLRGVCSSVFSYSYSEGIEGGYFLVLELLADTLHRRLEQWRKNRRRSFQNKWNVLNPRVNVKMMYERMQCAALGIANGMAYLHQQDIVIRDLKPANIGFDSDGNVRIFDFGFARKVNECDTEELCGSIRYMAPEVMTRQGCSLEADVYSFGIVLHELCSLTIAFETVKKHTTVEEFTPLVAEHHMRPKLNRIGCPSTKALIKECWDANAEKRPSFQKIYERIVEILPYDDTVYSDEVASTSHSFPST